jgi:DNA polymerase I-like protein with 3'-5' exonuclease and polymerase domains
MKELCLDVECNTYNKGNPYDSRGKLVSVHAHQSEQSSSYCVASNRRESDVGWADELNRRVDESSLIIGFNWKFDYTWLKKHGVNFQGKHFWDVQLAHFILRYQTTPFPSLNDVLTYYGLPLKHDKVAELWKQGVQTDDIEWSILCEYGEYDVQGTYDCYLRQVEEFKGEPKLYKLFKLACMDLEVLAEMEANGLKYNGEKCTAKSEELQKQIKELSDKLAALYPTVPINFNSNDQLSAFLYGGTVEEEYREMVGFYKTGAKAGQPKYQKAIKEHILPQLFPPLRGSEMAKEGVYSTAAETLKKLRGKNKWVVDILLSLAKLQNLDETYYRGLNETNVQMHWPEGILHSNYNQCRAVSGRLSSNNPNGQNLSGDVLEVFESRYND